MNPRFSAQILLVAAGFLAGSLLTWRLSQPAAVAAAPLGKVYEMRTYTTFEGRLPALERRFREHTLTLFERHGMKNIGYWIPQDAPQHSTTLVYILAHDSKEAALKSWAAFQADPEWKKVREASEADGKIVQKSERVFLDPTDYSPLK